MRYLLIQIFGCLACSVATVSFAEDPLIVAHDQWRASCTFTSTYRRYTLSGNELEWPDLSEVLSTPPDNVGVYHKREGLCRLSVIPSSPAEFVSSPDGEGEKMSVEDVHRIAISNRSWHAVFDGEMGIEYDVKWRNYFDRAVYTRRDELTPNARGDVCFVGEDELSPCNPFQSCSGRLPGMPEGFTEFDSREVSGDICLCTASIKTNDGYVSRYQVEWWTKPDVPVIQRVFHSRMAEGSNDGFEVESRLEGWVDCEGLMVASTVCSSLRALSPDRPTYSLFRIWHSDDLGQRPPVDEDFQIEIAESTRIVGLKDAPPKGTKRLISTFDVLPNQIVLGEVLAPSVGAIPKMSEAKSRVRWVWIVSGVFGVITVLVWKRQRSPR